MYDLQKYLTIYEWVSLFGFAFPTIAVLWAFIQLSSPQKICDSSLGSAFLILYTICIFTISPGTSTDKGAYMASFDYVLRTGDWLWGHDAIFYFSAYFIGILTNGSAFFWFAFIAGVYVFGHVFFCKKCFPGASFPILISFCVAFGFFSYGVNGLRSGVGIALLLIAVTSCVRYNSRALALIFGTLAIACHLTTIIPVSAFLLGHYIRKPKIFILGWLICFGLSLAFGASIQTYFGNLFEGKVDARISDYTLAEDSEVYTTGFRWDFLIYSLIGVLVPLFYKIRYNVEDKLYDLIFCAYLASNGFWLLLIRIVYSDRVAYLSWFLVPLILMVPLVRWKEIPGRGQKVSLCLLGQSGFFVFMMIYQSLKG